MNVYSFEIKWPLPFKQGWQTSGKRFDTLKEAATAMTEFLAVSAENDCYIEGRLVKID